MSNIKWTQGTLPSNITTFPSVVATPPPLLHLLLLFNIHPLSDSCHFTPRSIISRNFSTHSHYIHHHHVNAHTSSIRITASSSDTWRKTVCEHVSVRISGVQAWKSCRGKIKKPQRESLLMCLIKPVSQTVKSCECVWVSVSSLRPLPIYSRASFFSATSTDCFSEHRTLKHECEDNTRVLQ